MLAHENAIFGIFRFPLEVMQAKRVLATIGVVSSRIVTLHPTSRTTVDSEQQFKTMIWGATKIGGVVGAACFFFLGVLVSCGAISLPLPPGSITISSHILLVALVAPVGGMILGAAAGALIGIGTPQSAKRRFGDYVASGGILLSVQLQGNEEAKRIHSALEESGAQDITVLNERESWKSVRAKTEKSFGY